MGQGFYICYHGTDKENAESIRLSGFRRWTYFAKSLEDAVGFGGEYIFEVMFKEDELPRNYHLPFCWQFIIHKHWPPERIVDHYRLVRENIYENEQLKKEIDLAVSDEGEWGYDKTHYGEVHFHETIPWLFIRLKVPKNLNTTDV